MTPHRERADVAHGADIGVLGLGVMGAALARNFHSRNLTVATWNREPELSDEFKARYGDERFRICHTFAEFVGALQPPRRVLLMVTAGAAVDAVLESLAPFLSREDIVIDGGNSFWPDTERRDKWCRERGFRFVGMGVSGGEQGALEGPAMMPGGDPEAWERLRPVLELACARSDSGPCVDYCGRGGAGHFVKMVHNGIEYGDMQLIAEAWTLLRDGLGLPPQAVAQAFETWNRGELQSYLIEITARIVAARDPEGDQPLVDRILDVAGQKGTGRWTTIEAVQAGVPLSTVTAAVDGRALSALKAERRLVEAAYAHRAAPLPVLTVDDVRDALYASKLMSYTQGFALLRAGSEAHGFGTDLAKVSRIWKAGCIIRAGFLDRIYQAFGRDPALPLLVLDPGFRDDLLRCLPAWRKVVARAMEGGHAVPALAASLTYFDTLATAQGSARLIQAQRDYFGAHTYRRVEFPDIAVHSHWDALPRL